MAIKRKVKAHDIEKQTTNNIRSIIDADGRGLFRELTGRDYGIDAMVEIFDDGCITGKFGLIQCKGKNEPITPLKTSPAYILLRYFSSQYSIC